jgi:phosphoglycolate phosphatase
MNGIGESMDRKLVVFDWNGTLLSDTVASWKAANICLGFYGVAPISLQKYRETFHFPVIHFYRLNGCDVDEVLAKKNEANVIFQNAYEDLVKNARLRTGARDVLTWLKQREMPAIILSNYLTHRIEAQLNRLKIRDFFRDVSAHDDDGTKILEHTTKVDRLKDYMSKNGFQDAVIIGDSMEEPDIARVLNLTSVAITDGYITQKRLKEAKPTHIINNLRDLRSLLLQKCGLPD